MKPFWVLLVVALLAGALGPMLGAIGGVEVTLLLLLWVAVVVALAVGLHTRHRHHD